MERDEKLYQAKSTSLIYFFKVFLSSVKQTKFKILNWKFHWLRQGALFDERKLNVLDSMSPPLQIQLRPSLLDRTYAGLCWRHNQISLHL